MSEVPARLKDPRRFVPRCRALLSLEGWYDVPASAKTVYEPHDYRGYISWQPVFRDVPAYRFKLSCRFNDILRCSTFNGKKKHFHSCFSLEDAYSTFKSQPYKRCRNPRFAIVYTPDKHGNFLGRCFVEYKPWRPWRPFQKPKLLLGRIYGNKLNVVDVVDQLKNKVECQDTELDTYL